MAEPENLRRLVWEDILAEGENPKGYTGQTKNGTTHWQSRGWNKQWPYWPADRPEVEEAGPWQSPRSNRTGE